ncbi:MAG TPA: peptide-methionine (S)-S-oxide reductase MsrA [Bryobacteraceae bacterium]|nr:peptide-methionine (S)-S-oxide reductase MsrA [Bryobacteraceae bacterium]
MYKTPRILLCSLAGLTLACAASKNPFPEPSVGATPDAAKGKQTAVLAGGCFWGVDAVFKQIKGVSEVVSGFSGGEANTAHYERVSEGNTGHAESVKITYDPSQVSYGQLLKVFFAVAHDPTEKNRQGPDFGTQYRSVIFYVNEEQKHIAESYIAQLNAAHVFKKPIVTEVVPYKAFYAAEEYHQNFLERNPTYPYIVYNDLPKLDHLKHEFPEMVKGK